MDIIVDKLVLNYFPFPTRLISRVLIMILTAYFQSSITTLEKAYGKFVKSDYLVTKRMVA